MKVTFDTNCLIDLELKQHAGPYLEKLVKAHNADTLAIQVPAIAASERMPDGKYAGNFELFKKRVVTLSQKPFEILKPIGGYEITYLNWALLADEQMIQLEQQIHNILFPNHEFRWVDHAEKESLDPEDAAKSNHPEWQKWRNRKCDIAGVWCHIYHGGDVFLTRDWNFLKQSKKQPLEKIGAKRISEPAELIASLGLI